MVRHGVPTAKAHTFTAWDAAARYIDWSERNNPDLIWRNASQLTPLWYGDWLNADTFANLPNLPRSGGMVPREVYSTAFFARFTPEATADALP
jgi:hypothetical protein